MLISSLNSEMQIKAIQTYDVILTKLANESLTVQSVFGNMEHWYPSPAAPGSLNFFLWKNDDKLPMTQQDSDAQDCSWQHYSKINKFYYIHMMEYGATGKLNY